MNFRKIMPVLAALPLLLAGCLIPVDETVKAEELVGKWRIYRITEKEAKSVGDEEAPFLELLPNGQMRFHYREDDDKIEFRSGTWILKNGIVTINPGSRKSYELYVKSDDTMQRKLPPSIDNPEGVDLYLVK